MKRPTLIDAQQMATDHPATFQAPTAAELAGIVPGFFVKVCPAPKAPDLRTERFWVEVLEVTETGMSGRIDNALLLSHLHSLRCADQIEFEQRHIYQIEPPEDAE